ncbi:DEAD/DEAH box helicase family protein [Alkalihalobacillus sp. AL-G]|uniref:DEAD/DEAH box helicase family protein n=1 Tax=Alkalihalobacillus sp. AL-G TaxID=2926399 RepID=UPI00272A8657|nr:DEAD/DEAH box helicase family protein [Alkalihalobacillus sp. AL-G]WLD94462.1 DEAD/DEAH box helicase family protein [Alkalihalobacillus sp. AL-G]
MNKVELITEQLISYIQQEVQSAETIYILTSFVMKSGVDILKPHLVEAVNRGADVKVCAGDYLYITQTDALELLLKIDGIETRLWRSKGKSFHPKAYLFGREKDLDGSFIVGSSNMSASAFTTGIEWNLYMSKSVEPMTYEKAVDLYLKTFQHDNTIPLNYETLKRYNAEYEQFHVRHAALNKKWAKQEEVDLTLTNELPDNQVKEPPVEYVTTEEPIGTITPRPVQAEALESLEITFEENYDKSMVVMATGLGKTYLAGFFARNFNRVLFVAHREEILYQAKRSFLHIMPDKTAGIYNAKSKDTDCDFVFASVFTIGTDHNLKKFGPEHFDLIVVDEFHHAASNSYQRVIDYFDPKFLLGITATPDRMDNKDVYGICDGNVAYQLHFIEAIEKDWLTPFKYYGVYDDTDYSAITWLGNKYDQEELLIAQFRDDLAQRMLEAWCKHRQTRTLGFCSSIRQANFLSNYFKKQGYRTISLHSKTIEMSREEAIHKLTNKQLDIIFTVDLFNEGVDIPSIDTLLFARPTESLTVFTQQVGRGLRLHEGKKYCHIIDLIGNYRNADIKMSLFDTQPEKKKGKVSSVPQVPANCDIDLDLQVINLLDELQEKRQPRKEKLLGAYLDLKEELGRRPTYLELHLYGNANSREYKQEFKSYTGFLKWANELYEQEATVYTRYENWLKEVESTGMAKSYKMIVLLYMLNQGIDQWTNPVTPNEVAPFFHQYLTEKDFRKKIDFSDKNSQRMWEYDQNKVSKLISDMPMSKWAGSSKGLVSFIEGTFKLEFDVLQEDNQVLYEWTKQICEYRLHEHFERKTYNQSVNR